MAHLKELAGKNWHEWPQTQLVEDMEALSPSPPPTSSSTSCSTSITPTSSRSHSPKPDDVMKLPRSEMDIFGQCPNADELILVSCDLCGKSVKIEAFASHVKIRHQKGGRFAIASKPSAQQFSLQDEASLLKDELDSGSTSSLFSLSTKVNPTSAVVKPAPPESPSRPLSAASSTTRPSSRSSIGTGSMDPLALVEAAGTSIEPMEVDSRSSSIGVKTENLDDDIVDLDEMSSNSNNVISIPDTNPLPHGGMSSSDLMAMVSGATTPDSSSSKTPPVLRLQVNPTPASSSGGKPMSSLLLSSAASSGASTPPPPSSSSSKKSSPGKLGGRNERKPLREYHADKHCGVWDNESKRHCTRALTCKSHSVLLKRKVEGRSQTFDVLVAAHKKAQAEAAAAQQQQQHQPPSTPSPIHLNGTPTRTYTPTVSVKAPPSMAQVVSKISPVLSVQQQQQPPSATPSMISTALAASPTTSVIGTRYPVHVEQPQPLQSEDSNLHYTTDHPRPLAICGFRGAGRRVGGLIVADRNHVLTRKLVRVAITAGTAASFGGAGFHRIRPRVFIGQPGGNGSGGPPSGSNDQYVLNYSLSGNLKRGNLTPVGGVNLTPLPPGGSPRVVIPDSFKTDMQDFKGGIKFELGRKIKHIPSGSEMAQ